MVSLISLAWKVLFGLVCSEPLSSRTSIGSLNHGTQEIIFYFAICISHNQIHIVQVLTTSLGMDTDKGTHWSDKK